MDKWDTIFWKTCGTGVGCKYVSVTTDSSTDALYVTSLLLRSLCYSNVTSDAVIQESPNAWFERESVRIQAEARERERAEMQRQGLEGEEWEKFKQAAVRRSEGLLRRHLDFNQRLCFDASRQFYVPMSRLYRIDYGHQRNVVEYRENLEVHRWCLHPTEWVPDADTMLAQLLLLRNDEAGFRNRANQSSPHVPWN